MEINYFGAHLLYLPRPIEDATPRATHQSPNRKYSRNSSRCCKTNKHF